LPRRSQVLELQRRASPCFLVATRPETAVLRLRSKISCPSPELIVDLSGHTALDSLIDSSRCRWKIQGRIPPSKRRRDRQRIAVGGAITQDHSTGDVPTESRCARLLRKARIVSSLGRGANEGIRTGVGRRILRDDDCVFHIKSRDAVEISPRFARPPPGRARFVGRRLGCNAPESEV